MISKDFNNSKDIKELMDNPKVTKLGMLEEASAKSIDRDYEFNSAVLIGITSEVIETNYTKYLTSFYDAILDSEKGRTCKFLMSTSAYDNDTREVFEVPEFVDFIKAVFKEKPALFALMEMREMSWVIIIHCMTGFQKKQGDNQTVAMDITKIKKFAFDIIRAMKNDKRFSTDNIETFRQNYCIASNLSYQQIFGY